MDYSVRLSKEKKERERTNGKIRFPFVLISEAGLKASLDGNFEDSKISHVCSVGGRCCV